MQRQETLAMVAHMLQQNLYNENNRYLKWVFKNYKQFLDLDITEE